MTLTDWIGSLGVFLILLAYFLSVIGKLNVGGLAFICMNIVGAGMACLASIMLDYLPFIILEGAWTAVSILSLVKHLKARKTKNGL